MAQLKNRMAGAFALLVIASACSVANDKIQTAFITAIVGGVMAGIALGLINMISAAVPLCCGCGAEAVKKNKKTVGAVVVILGLLCCFIPLFASMGACASTADTVCNDCAGGCSAADREDVEGICNLLGVFVVYLYGFGFIAVALGVASATLGCCICCSCCKLKEPPATAGGGAVVGQPVIGAIAAQ